MLNNFGNIFYFTKNIWSRIFIIFMFSLFVIILITPLPHREGLGESLLSCSTTHHVRKRRDLPPLYVYQRANREYILFHRII